MYSTLFVFLAHFLHRLKLLRNSLWETYKVWYLMVVAWYGRSTSSIISITSLLVTSSSSSSLVEVLQTSTLMVLCLYPHIPQELHQCVRTIISRPEFSLHLYAVCVTLFLCSTAAAHLKLNKIIFYRQHQLLQRFKTISFVKYLFLALDF